MVARDSLTSIFVDRCHESSLNICGQLFAQMHTDTVFTFCIENFNNIFATRESTTVAHLTTHFGIERSYRENDLIELVIFLFHFAVTQNLSFGFGIVITHKHLFAFTNYNPVCSLNSSSIASASFLGSHFGIKTFVVEGHIVFFQDEFCQVQGETISIIENKRFFTRDFGFASFFCSGNSTIEQTDTVFESAQERIFLFFDNLHDKVALCGQFGISLTHALNESVHQAIHKGLFLVEECICITNCTTQDAANYITGLSVAWQL